jgi:hypothetical protein
MNKSYKYIASYIILFILIVSVGLIGTNIMLLLLNDLKPSITENENTQNINNILTKVVITAPTDLFFLNLYAQGIKDDPERASSIVNVIPRIQDKLYQFHISKPAVGHLSTNLKHQLLHNAIAISIDAERNIQKKNVILADILHKLQNLRPLAYDDNILFGYLLNWPTAKNTRQMQLAYAASNFMYLFSLNGDFNDVSGSLYEYADINPTQKAYIFSNIAGNEHAHLEDLKKVANFGLKHNDIEVQALTAYNLLSSKILPVELIEELMQFYKITLPSTDPRKKADLPFLFRAIFVSRNISDSEKIRLLNEYYDVFEDKLKDDVLKEQVWWLQEKTNKNTDWSDLHTRATDLLEKEKSKI